MYSRSNTGKYYQPENKSGKKINDLPLMSERKNERVTLPLNYGGTRYGGFCADEDAARRLKDTEKSVGNGLENITGQDEKYRDYRKNTVLRTYEAPLAANQNTQTVYEEKKPSKGLEKMIKSLENGDFSTDDLLLGSLILLMLGSSGDDDIVLVLVLMTLL